LIFFVRIVGIIASLGPLCVLTKEKETIKQTKKKKTMNGEIYGFGTNQSICDARTLT
jgi:hypothetical protein